jgi:mannose-6-phosphate isomerase-like protein (cupin superfamily)
MADTLPRLHPAASAETLHVLGDRVALRGALTGSPLHLVEVTVPPGSGVPPHRHASPETFRVLSGTAAFAVETAQGMASVTAGEGDMLTVPPMALHGYRNPSDRPLVFQAILAASMIDFFREVAAPGTLQGPPPPEAVAAVLAAAARHGIVFAAPSAP